MKDKEKYLKSAKRKALINITIAVVYNVTLFFFISKMININYRASEIEIIIYFSCISLLFFINIFSFIKWFYEKMGNYYVMLEETGIRKRALLNLSSAFLCFPLLNLLSIIFGIIFLLEYKK